MLRIEVIYQLRMHGGLIFANTTTIGHFARDVSALQMLLQ